MHTGRTLFTLPKQWSRNRESTGTPPSRQHHLQLLRAAQLLVGVGGGGTERIAATAGTTSEGKAELLPWTDCCRMITSWVLAGRCGN